MNNIETFNEFLVNNNESIIPWVDFLINLIIGLILAYAIRYTYVICGKSVSNRKNLANNFPLLVLTTLFVITIVKSSLALSLGLVGALSIVRFRTAVKEPVELLYLFLSISVGLGLGANQKAITIISILFILGFIWVLFYFFDNDKNANQNMILTISSNEGSKIELDKIINILIANSNTSNLIRLDESKNSIEAHFEVQFSSLEQLNKFRESSYFVNNNLSFSLLTADGLI